MIGLFSSQLPSGGDSTSGAATINLMVDWLTLVSKIEAAGVSEITFDLHKPITTVLGLFLLLGPCDRILVMKYLLSKVVEFVANLGRIFSKGVRVTAGALNNLHPSMVR